MASQGLEACKTASRCGGKKQGAGLSADVAANGAPTASSNKAEKAADSLGYKVATRAVR